MNAYCGRISMLVLLCAGAAATGQDRWTLPERFDVWPSLSLSGANTLRWEYYANHGNKAGNFYPSVGPQLYDELRLDFSRDISPYQSWRGSLNGLYNNSEYRARDEGFIPETFRFLWENGEAAIPFRLEAGDIFAFYSLRTMQRSLKGFQIEFQPAARAPWDLEQSLQLTAGAPLADYRHGHVTDDFYHGASWLLHNRSTDLSLNLMRNSRRRINAGAGPSLHQTVYSVAATHRHELLGQTLTFDGEAAFLQGNPPTTGATTKTDVSERGWYFAMNGHSRSPLTYQFRFEDYGRQFQPNGASVSPDRRTWDGRLGWRFGSGLMLNTRLQRYTDGRDSGNATDTNVAGISLSGPLRAVPIKGLNMYLDAFVQNVSDDDATTDNRLRNVRLDLSAPIDDLWTGRVGVSAQGVLDKIGTADTTVYETTVGGTRRISVLGLSGSITPGLSLRTVDSSTSAENLLGASLGLSLSGKHQSVNLSYRFQFNDPDAPGSTDVGTHSFEVAYNYTHGPHMLTADIGLQQRDPENDSSSRGLRAGITWTVQFGNAPRKGREPPIEVRPITTAAGTLQLADLRPGTPVADVVARLEQAGIRGGVELPGVTVYEVRFFPDLTQRQRLAVVHRGGRVTRVAVLVDLAATGDPDTAQQTLARIQRTLVRRYGRPETYDKGQFSGNLASDINSRNVVRLSEWRVRGGVLRLGFPRRTDGLIRIELQFAPSFPPRRETLWSIESVR